MAKNYTGNFKLSFQILVQNFDIEGKNKTKTLFPDVSPALVIWKQNSLVTQKNNLFPQSWLFQKWWFFFFFLILSQRFLEMLKMYIFWQFRSKIMVKIDDFEQSF